MYKRQGDNRINLRQKSLAKLQSSHTAFGEDNKIYTIEEIIDQFRMFEEREEERDIRTQYLEWLRSFKANHKEHFEKIDRLPLKIRCIRKGTEPLTSIAYVRNGDHKNIYWYQNDVAQPIPFEKAVKIFVAEKDEKGIMPILDIHYDQVNEIINQFEKDITAPELLAGRNDNSDVRTQTAMNFIGQLQRCLLYTSPSPRD